MWHTEKFAGKEHIGRHEHLRSSPGLKITSTLIGAWKCNFLPFLGMYDRSTEQPIQKDRIRGPKKVTFPNARCYIKKVF